MNNENTFSITKSLEQKLPRKIYLDNIRWMTIILVMIYHVFYVFNSAGVVSNIVTEGIPAFDSFLTFVYPWFMCLLFLIAGMSARYALISKTKKQYLKERFRKLIVPFFGGIFLIGWINGWVTSQYVDIFAGQSVPLAIKYLIYCAMGMGPLWFILELFVGTLLLFVIIKLDKKEVLLTLGRKTNIILLFLFFIPIWGSSYVLITPVITIFRNGIYWFLFLLGYFVLSHEEVLLQLKKYRIVLGIVAFACGIGYSIFYYGENYVLDQVLQSPLTNIYLWIMILAILGLAKQYLNFTGKISSFLSSRSFSYFVLHYPILILVAHFLVSKFDFPIILNYLLVLMITVILTCLLSEIAMRLPVIRYWLFGMKKETKLR